MSHYRILVVEDDRSIGELIRTIFLQIGYSALVVANGDEALELLKKEAFDLVTLDINLPGLDGFTVLRRLRNFSNIPVIILSVRNSETDRIEAIQHGADDYITKPFENEQVIEHAKALLQRSPRAVTMKERPFDDGYLRIHFNQRRVSVNEKDVKLATIEYELLHELVTNAPSVLTYDRLLGDIWGTEYKDAKNLLHDHINRLRNAIEPDTHNPQYIINIQKVGYRFNHTG